MPRHHIVDGQRVDFTSEEESARDAVEQAWANGAVARAQARLREKRNSLLAETDFYALSDVTMSSDMATYRQNLRDLPDGKDTVDKCDNVTWPTKPG
jgi:TPP-dependent pyruvate/acetoin dehydrogenase alpha subunit